MDNRFVPLVVAFGCACGGCLLNVQAGANIALGKQTRHAFWGSFFSFLGSTLVVSLATLRAGSVPFHAAVLAAAQETQKDWTLLPMWAGGVLGAFYVSSTVLLAPYVGLSVWFIGVVCGQVLSSGLIDHFALLWSARRPLPRKQLGGVALLLCGAALFQTDKITAQSQTASTSKAGGGAYGLVVMLAVLSGAAFPSQAAVNRRLSRALDSPWSAAFVSFLTGTVWIFLAASLSTQTLPPPPDQLLVLMWEAVWKWVGGAIGAYTVIIMIMGPQHIGMSAVFSWFVCGQLCASLVFDAVGAFGLPVCPVTAFRVAGLTLVLVGVAIIHASKSGAPAAPGPGGPAAAGATAGGAGTTELAARDAEKGVYVKVEQQETPTGDGL